MLLPLYSTSIAAATVEASVIDFADFSLTAFWKNYSVGNWAGTASATGSVSGSKTLTFPGTAPSATTLNGIGVASFAGGSNVGAVSGSTIDDFANNNEISGSILVKYTGSSLDTDPGYAQRYKGMALLTDGASYGYFHIGFNQSGFYASVYDGGYKDVLATATVSNYNAVQFRLQSGTLSIRVNNGSWASISCGTIDSMSGPLTIGNGYGSDYLYADVAHITLATPGYTYSNSDFDNIVATYNSTYGLAL